MNKFSKYESALACEELLVVVQEGVLECIEGIAASENHKKIFLFAIEFDTGNGTISFFLVDNETVSDKFGKEYNDDYEFSSEEKFDVFLNDCNWKHIDEMYAKNFNLQFYPKWEDRLISLLMKMTDELEYEFVNEFEEYLVDKLANLLVSLFKQGEFDRLPIAEKFAILVYRGGCVDTLGLDRMRMF